MRIIRLPVKRWREYRDIRLEALKSEPLSFGRSYSEAVNIPAKEWKRNLNDGRGYFLFAEEKGKLIGLARLNFNSLKKGKHRAGITEVFVKKEFRGRKVGFELITGAIKQIKKRRDMKRIDIGVLESAPKAFLLYKQIGFKEIGKQHKELKFKNKYYDLILMEMLI